jgi:two-component system NtrC family sensor kinase
MRLGIGARVVGGVALVIAAAVAATTALHVRADESARVAQLLTTARQLSETIKRSTQRDMMENHRERLQEQIDAVGHQDGIEGVRIVNKEGRIAFSSDRGEVGRVLAPDADTCRACHDPARPLPSTVSSPVRLYRSRGHRVLGVVNPVANAPGCSTAACHGHTAERSVLGVLDVGLSLADFDDAARAAQRRAFLVALSATLASGVVLWWLTGRLVVRPVEALAAATRRVAEGEHAVVVPVTGGPELADLADSFNEMTRRLTDAQRQLAQADKLAAVGRLAAGLAHEINNPLTAVLTYASIWQKRAPDPALVLDLETIVRETKRCREIVKGLLDFARPAPPLRQPTDLNDVARRAAAVTAPALARSGVELLLRLDDTLPPVPVDGNQIEQVLVNLLLNAADAVAADGTGRIEITTGRAGDAVEVGVRDNGRGIPSEERAHLFEPFFTTKGTHGTGLGLSVSWGIVQAHGGTIDVAGEPGAGTTFTLHLPVAAGLVARRSPQEETP